MATSPSHDRPTSSLLDRLVQHDDDVSIPPRVARKGSQSQSRRQHQRQLAELHELIQLDLLSLFSTRRMSADVDLSAWPAVRDSVLNYGVPDLSGATPESIQTGKLAKELTRIVRLYEPRLHRRSVIVVCRVDHHFQNDLEVTIQANFGPVDAIQAFEMGVTIGLDSGNCVRQSGRRAA